MKADETKSCEQCRLYAKLQEPFHYEKLGYPDGVTVYGFCTKDINRLHSFYPVYLPDGGSCNDFICKSQNVKQHTQPVDGQLCIEV